MVDIENKYYEVSADGVDSQPTLSRLLSKVVMTPVALISGSCLVLVLIAATYTSSSTFRRTGAVGSTDLVGLSPVSGAAAKPGSFSSMGISALPGSGPFKNIAISAIKVNNLQRMQDVTQTRAEVHKPLYGAPVAEKLEELEEELSEMDEEVKEDFENIEDVVHMKAHDLAGRTGSFFKRSAHYVKPKEMAGITGPLGFFDPLGFSTDCSDGKLLFFREVELKHGRVAMLATLGILVGEQFHPLFGGDINVPSYIAFQQTPLQTFWPAVMIALAIPEIASIRSFEAPDGTHDMWWTIRPDHKPGDLGFDPLGLKPEDPEELKIMQSKELNNGRLAMIAAAGMIAQEFVTGNKLF